MKESKEANGDTDTDHHWKGQKAGLEEGDPIEMNTEKTSKLDLHRRAPDFWSRNFAYCTVMPSVQGIALHKFHTTQN